MNPKLLIVHDFGIVETGLFSGNCESGEGARDINPLKSNLIEDLKLR
jgi:hypothetical protein